MLALTFPGQGSQKVGMGKELSESSAIAHSVFAEVDDALNEKLSETIWHGTDDDLTKTQNAQPALMAMSLAVFKVLESSGLSLESAKYVAGHSLGEYSALAASGSLSITDAAKLLRTRGEAMQSAVSLGEGSMAAIIGLEESAVEQVCNDVSTSQCSCQIANDNGGGQWVISGHTDAVTKATDEASKAGAKRAIPLSVSAPFHSVLMQPVADKMQEALESVVLTPPKVPIVCNVLAAPITDPAEIKSKLIEQVTARVRWRETIDYIAGEGVTKVAELGSGKVLSGLAKRISRDVVPRYH